MACEQGIYERENLQLLQSLVRPGTWMFDVGANIGLMAVPILRSAPQAKVLSFEPSPNSLRFLERTLAESGLGDRWKLIPKSVGAVPGITRFFVSASETGCYDGVAETGRAGKQEAVDLPMTTLDVEWEALGCPEVSVIKIDVEGWESQVILGGMRLFKEKKPYVLLEWEPRNLEKAGVVNHQLLEIADRIGYKIFTPGEFIEVANSESLQLQMRRNDSFLLAPKG